MNYWIAKNPGEDGPLTDERGRPHIIGSLSKSAACLCPAPPDTANGDGEIVRVYRSYEDPRTGEIVELPTDQSAPKINHTPPGAKKAVSFVPPVRWAAVVDEDARSRRDAARAKSETDRATHERKYAYRQKRKMQYALRLSGDRQSATALDALGDVVDLLVARVREIEVSVADLPENKEWNAMLGKIDAIKAEIPKGS